MANLGHVRARATILAVASVLMLPACSGDPEDTPSTSLTDTTTIDCDEYADTAKTITDAQTALYNGDQEAIDTLVSELDELKQGAPSDVKAALTDIEGAFRDAQDLMQDWTPEKQVALAELGPKISEAGQKITAYIAEECQG